MSNDESYLVMRDLTVNEEAPDEYKNFIMKGMRVGEITFIELPSKKVVQIDTLIRALFLLKIKLLSTSDGLETSINKAVWAQLA
jgi:hypothetical protein